MMKPKMGGGGGGGMMKPKMGGGGGGGKPKTTPKTPKMPKTPKTPKQPAGPKPKQTQPMGSTGAAGPKPVMSGVCNGVCQDINTQSCSTGYLTGLCPGASNIKCCPSGGSTPPPPVTPPVSGSDWSVMQTVQSQHNTKMSVGSYSGVPNGFYQTSNGALVYQGKMDTDCDGAPSCPSIDPSGQTSTSFTYSGKAIDALKTNYVVLPSDLSRKLGSHIKLGDIVAVGYNGHVSYAVYADNGPLGKAGEGSVHLSLELGFNPYCGSKVCKGISSGVSYVVFPGSRSRYTSPYDASTIAAAGASLLRAQVN